MSQANRFIRYVCITLAACFSLSLTVSSSAQTKAIAVPVDFEIYLLTAGGTRELQPEWTDVGRVNAQSAFETEGEKMFDLVAAPELTDDEQAVFDEHIALYNVAVRNSITMINEAKLKHKVENYDYTVGSGLSFLKDKTDADKLYLFTGEQEKSSGGRIAMMMLGAVAGAATGVYVIPGVGGSYGILGIVDIETGNIEWVNYKQPIGGDYRKEKVANKSVGALMEQFPNGKLMKSVIEY